MLKKVKSASSELRWYRSRGYSHFDSPLSRQSAASLVQDPLAVARHSFFPFISYQLESLRYDRVKRSKIPKSRLVAYAAHQDAAIFSYYSHLLSKPFEAALETVGLAENILAYRKMKQPSSNIDFCKRAFDDIRTRKNCVAVGLDLESFFDTIPHSEIKSNWAKLVGCQHLPDDHFKVYQALTRWVHVDREDIRTALGLSKRRLERSSLRLCDAESFRTLIRDKGLIQKGFSHTQSFRGIPQGSPMSGIVSNFALLSVDEAVLKAANANNVTYMRYSDDILLIGEEEAVRLVEDIFTSSITSLGMSLNAAKRTESTFSLSGTGTQTSDKPLQYLGFTFDGERILIRSQTIARSIRRMKGSVRSVKSAARAAARRGRPGRTLKTKLYAGHTHLSHKKRNRTHRHSNFWGYSQRAKKKLRSMPIQRQLRGHWKRLTKELEKP